MQKKCNSLTFVIQRYGLKIGNIILTFLAILFDYSSIKSQQIPHKLDSMLSKTLYEQQIILNNKGLTASLEMPNGSVWSGAAGISAEGINMDTSMTFGIGSITKTITAAYILKLTDEKYIKLDDSLFVFFDSLPYINPNITVRQLLRHQSGLFDVVNAPGFQEMLWENRDSIWTLKDIITSFMYPPIAKPGQQFQYCNTNYLLLGMIAEKVKASSHAEIFRNELIGPLHLNNLFLKPFEHSSNEPAHVWLDLDGDQIVDDAHDIFSNWHSIHAATSSAGSYYATSADLVRWIQTYFSGSLLSKEIYNEAKISVNTNLPNNVKYGLGLMTRSYLGYTALGHGGDFAYSASAWYFPLKNISIAVLNNDGSKNSWTLGPVVQALFKTYLDYQLSSDVSTIQNASLHVYPNPFTNEISYTCLTSTNDNLQDVFISNELGQPIDMRIVRHENLNTIQLGDNLPKGIYYLHIITASNHIVEKIVKK